MARGVDCLQSKSNLSLLGFEFVDGELVAPVVPPPVPVVPPQQLPPAVPPVATPPAYTANDPLDDGDRGVFAHCSFTFIVDNQYNYS